MTTRASLQVREDMTLNWTTVDRVEGFTSTAAGCNT